ncbi:hypothetical protein [Mesobacillus harenae]|uniref:hypothetical protein n=1 Tax=Mesobacillus harenae TaxID=2213203 RepID=UPI001580727E|nr:hypothetical protein [Mesobacillus harenae]
MRDKKEKREESKNLNQVQSEELFEISQTGYGLESVEKGCDFAEGDQANPPDCGGL